MQSSTVDSSLLIGHGSSPLVPSSVVSQGIEPSNGRERSLEPTLGSQTQLKGGKISTVYGPNMSLLSSQPPIRKRSRSVDSILCSLKSHSRRSLAMLLRSTSAMTDEQRAALIAARDRSGSDHEPRHGHHHNPLSKLFRKLKI